MPNIFRAYTNKVSNKLFGVTHMPALGKKKGDVLLSYLTGPFTQLPREYFTDPHTNYWECAEIARLFTERGYAVDSIDARNTTFIPHKKYAVCIDVLQNLERLTDYLPKECKKVMHITNAYTPFQNAAEETRLANLAARRGIQLKPRRREPVSSNPAYADLLEGFGTEVLYATYAQFNKKIHPIPISVSQLFPFPDQKDFEHSRTHFLWFGGGGAVHKGLDLVVEAFAAMPEYHLDIVGPAAFEEDFAEAYKKELALTNITRYHRPQMHADGTIWVDGIPFFDIANKSAAIIFPSCSESASGSVIQAMHAGLVPIITPEANISKKAGGMYIHEPTVNAVQETVRAFSLLTPKEIRNAAHIAWSYVRNHHTKKTFSAAYAHFIDEIIQV